MAHREFIKYSTNFRKLCEYSMNLRWACGGHSRDLPGLCCGRRAAKAQEWRQRANRELIKYSTIFRKIVEYLMTLHDFTIFYDGPSQIYQIFEDFSKNCGIFDDFRMAHRQLIKYSKNFRKLVEFLMNLDEFTVGLRWPYVAIPGPAGPS